MPILPPPVQTRADYTGVENLEVMREAVRYNAFLADLVRTPCLRPEPSSISVPAAAPSRAPWLHARVPLSASNSTTACVSVSRGKNSTHAGIGELPADSLDGVYR